MGKGEIFVFFEKIDTFIYDIFILIMGLGS